MPGRLRCVVLLGLVTVSAACGTTVPLSQQQVGSGLGTAGSALTTDSGRTADGAGSTVPAAGGLAPIGSIPSGQTSGTESGSAASNPLPARSQTSAGSAGAPTTGGAPASPPGRVPTKGPGWDAKTVSIGVLTQKDAQQAFAAAGYSGINTGDTEAQAKAVIADVNRRGGLFGRQVKPEFVDVPTLNSAENPDAAGNVVCSHFSEDHPVVAVVNIIATLDVDSFRACLAKHKIFLFDAADVAVDGSSAQALAPQFLTGTVPSWNALAPIFISRLQAQGDFTGWDAVQGRAAAGKAPKIGLLVLENAIGKHPDHWWSSKDPWDLQGIESENRRQIGWRNFYRRLASAFGAA